MNYCQCNRQKHLLKTFVLIFGVGQYSGTVTRYIFSTVIGTVDIFLKIYRFWYRRYFSNRFTRYFGNFFLSKLKGAKAENFPFFSAKSIFEKYRETTLL